MEQPLIYYWSPSPSPYDAIVRHQDLNWPKPKCFTGRYFSECSFVFGLSESEHSGRKRVNQIMIFTKRKSNASRELVRKRNEFTLTVVQSKQNFLNGICVTVSWVIEFLLVGRVDSSHPYGRKKLSIGLSSFELNSGVCLKNLVRNSKLLKTRCTIRI